MVSRFAMRHSLGLATALWLAGGTAAIFCGQTQNPAMRVVRVPATANPYLAGMPAGTKVGDGDRAPEQSPVLVDLSLMDAVAVTFAVSGGMEHQPGCPPFCDRPDGADVTRHMDGPENGISNIVAPYDSLLGVFLDDARPDKSRAPRTLDFESIGMKFLSLSPQLQQLFFIGSGKTKKGEARRYLVPKGATRLFLGTMDFREWNNNTGLFQVAITVERAEALSNTFSVNSGISFAKWACLPDKSQCTPERPMVEARGPGQYHMLLPAQSEWGVSIPLPAGSTYTVHGAIGTVCLDSGSRSTSSCNGPQGTGIRGGAGFLAPDEGIGALVGKTMDGRAWFSVNDRPGDAFQNHQGYFEFDVTIQ